MALYRPLTFVHHLLQKHLHPQAYIVDATLGNGNDALFISKLLNQNGRIFGFDIQNIAIENTKKRISQETPKCHITFFQQSHSEMLTILPEYQEKIDCVLFNLGYLPHHDETITTMLNTTYKAILQALMLLKQKGILIVVAYPGHENGQQEFLALHQLFAKANPNYYYITHYLQTNAFKNPPSVFIIEKK